MAQRETAAMLGLVLLAACSVGEETSSREPDREPAPTEATVAAVDGTTSSTLVDDTFTLRYLVRYPVTLDATAVEAVPAGEGYRIAHAIGTDSLVLELRLEAPSYQRLDTVLALAWGESRGTVEFPLTPRTTRVAGGGSGAQDTAQDAGSRPEAGTPPTAGSLSALEEGDGAFSNADWAGAIRAYSRMPRPTNREGEYAFDYELALVRRGISHINLGQWEEANEVLREAVEFDFREYTAFFYLGQVQCVLGQYDAGRESLRHIPDWLTLSISEGQRPIVLTLVEYQLAMCTYGQAQQARTQSELMRLRNQARQEFEAFIQRAEALAPMPPELEGAVADARQRLAEVRAP